MSRAPPDLTDAAIGMFVEHSAKRDRGDVFSSRNRG